MSKAGKKNALTWKFYSRGASGVNSHASALLLRALRISIT